MIKFSKIQQISDIFYRLVSLFQVVSVRGRVKVLSKMHVYFAVFCFVVAVLTPCCIKFDSLLFCEVLSEFLVSHDVAGEILFKNFHESLPWERVVVNAKSDSRVNFCESGVKCGLKLDGRFVSFFSDGNCYGGSVPDKCADTSKDEVDKRGNTTFRHELLTAFSLCCLGFWRF